MRGLLRAVRRLAPRPAQAAALAPGTATAVRGVEDGLESNVNCQGWRLTTTVVRCQSCDYRE